MEGRVRVVFLATALPPLKVVTVTFETVGFVAAFRVLRFAGALVAVLEGVAVGINSLVACLLLNYKRKRVDISANPVFCNEMKQLLQPDFLEWDLHAVNRNGTCATPCDYRS